MFGTKKRLDKLTEEITNLRSELIEPLNRLASIRKSDARQISGEAFMLKDLKPEYGKDWPKIKKEK